MKRLFTICCIAALLPGMQAFGQCPNTNTLLMNYVPVCDGLPHQATACIHGGEYVAVTVTAGNVYIFSTCAGNTFDSQLTIYNSTGGTAIDYNDDFCSLQSQITWTATFSGTLWVLVNKYSCTADPTLCLPLTVTCTIPPPPPPPNPLCLSPLPDDCSVACNLGALPTPAPCVSGIPTAVGATVSYSGTNVGATAANPYSAVTGCANPASDIWLRFQATGTQLILSLNADTGQILNTPNISLYNGNSCNALLPLTCFSGTNGSLPVTTFSPLTPGDEYYIQISGGTPADQGNFILAIQNNYDCDACLLTENIAVTPAPVNGTYQPNQTVSFCFTVSNYNQTAANWLHGITLSLGPGWKPGTLVPGALPTTCTVSPGANWGFYNSVTGTATGQHWGPGFFYETSAGNATGVVDNNPGDNFGDAGVGASCPITFCWQITTKGAGGCVNGTSLHVGITTTGDYLSGSWTSPGCQNDPVANFNASLSCCLPPAITSTPTSCGLSNGSATATATGTGPWQYTWADTSGAVVSNLTVNGPSTISNLASGQYFLTVVDNTNCSTTGVATVAPSNAGVALTSNTGPYCPGQLITLGTIAGASSYSWSGPNGFTSGSQSPTIPNANNTLAGIYDVTVTFPAGCTAAGSDTVVVNSNPTAVITPNTVTICTGDSTLLIASGGATYLWSNSATTDSIFVNPNSASSYTVTVTDSNSCTATTTANVSLYAVPVGAIAPVNASVCSGNSVTLTASGGVSYVWSNGAVTDTYTVAPNTATTYTVTLTDANGCTATASKIVNINTAPVISVIPLTATICSGQTVTLTAAGGVTYQWSDGTSMITDAVSPASSTTYVVTGTDANGCSGQDSAQITVVPIILTTTPASVTCFGGSDGAVDLTVAGGTTPYVFIWSNTTTTQNISSVPAGSYTVTVNDNAGCSVSTTEVVSQPTQLVITETHANGACSGGGSGSIDITVTGGTTPYTYLWSDGNTTEDRTGLAAGNYTVTATDANLCTVTITDTILTPLPLAATDTFQNAICNGSATGSIDVTITGGTPPYTYFWNDSITTEGRQNIYAGSYSVVITDNNNCTTAVSAVITEPSISSISETHTNVSCFGGNDASINTTTTGGTPPYSYLWNDGITTQNRTALIAGTYTMTATDSNGCIATLSQPITEPTLLTLSEAHTDITCNGYSDGSITLTPGGGTLPYAYNWNDGVTAQNRPAIPVGNYTVTLTDADACTATTAVNLPDPPGMSITSNAVNPTCVTNPADGSIGINVTGGTQPYSFVWSNGFNTTGITLLGPGVYTVTVTDANSCTADSVYTLVYQYAFSVTANPAVTIGLQESTTLGFILTGTTGNYTSIWSPSASLSCTDCPNPVAAPFVSTLYQVLITNEVGCIASDTVSVFVSPEYDLYIPNAFSPNGDGNNDLFEVYGKALKTVSMKIFNRWGELVYATTNQFNGWDGIYKGEPLPTGVYIYEVKATFLNDKVVEKTGSVSLIR